MSNRLNSHKKIVSTKNNRRSFKFIIDLYRLRLNKEYFVINEIYVRVKTQNRS